MNKNLNSIKHLPTIDKVGRDKLFYDQYEYCLKFLFTELSSLRERNHDSIKRTLKSRSYLRSINFGGSWRYNNLVNNNITSKTIDSCLNFCDFLNAIQQDFKLVISLDQGFMYTNDFDLVADLCEYQDVHGLELKQAIVDRPKNSIVIKNSQHNFRTYFKSQNLVGNQKEQLANFLENQADIRIGPGTRDWISRYRFSNYVADNYFVDHNDEAFLTMLSLVSPIKIKKTVTIINDK